MVTDPDALARLLVTTFFAVVFGQSALDKVLDRRGNLDYFSEHFAHSPFPKSSVPLLLSVLTLIEGTAAVLCALGVVAGDWAGEGMGVAAAGVIAAAVALLCLLLGQRLAKDYAGAAVVAAYFAVALIGVALF
jgi:hypothetical protein